MKNNDLVDKSKAIMQQFDSTHLKKEKYFINSIDYRREYKLGTFPHHRMFPVTKGDRERIFAKKEKKAVTLYVHIPFCVSKCQFCYLTSFPNCSQSVVNTYIDALKKEADLLFKKIDDEDLKIPFIYFGGGTLTYLPGEQMQDLIIFLKKKFKIKDTAEISCEVSPMTIAGKKGQEKLKILFNNGVTRINLGIQSFSDDVLNIVERHQTTPLIVSNFDSLRKVGFDDINVDLMIGLPRQTVKGWNKTIEMTASLQPDKISFFSLVMRSPKMYTLYLSNPELFPSENTRLLMNIMIVEGLRARGYVWREMETFLSPQKKRNIFFSPSVGPLDIIGLGVSAHSFMNNYQYTNCYDIKKYMHSISKGILPLWLGVEFSKDQIMMRQLIHSLSQLHPGIDKQEIVTAFGIDVEKFLYTELKELREKQMIIEDKGVIKLSEKGVFFADAIFQGLCHRMYDMKNMQGLIPVLRRLPATISLINRKNVKIFLYQKLCRAVK
ncbi:MAG: coproporphyrinogen-III oxidase family protein [Candidatus Omnitrophota bacterium]